MDNDTTLEYGRSAVFSSVSVFYGKIIGFLLSLIYYILIIRVLTPSIYGIYTIVISFVGIFASVNNFGLATIANKYVSYYLSKKADKKITAIVTNTVAISLSITFILTFVTLIAASLVNSYYNNELTSIFVLVGGLGLFLNIINGTATGVFIALRKNRYVFIIPIFESFVRLIAVAILLYMIKLYVFGALLSLLISALLTDILSFYYYHKERLISIKSLSREEIHFIIKEASQIGVSNLFNDILYNLSSVILGLFVSYYYVGLYGFSNRVVSLLGVFTASISLSSLALINAFKDSKDYRSKAFRYSLRYSMLFMAPMLTFIAFNAYYLISLVFSKAYTGAALYMEIIALSFIISLFASRYYELAIALGRYKQILLMNIIVDIAVALVSIIAIMRYGTLGAVFIFYSFWYALQLIALKLITRDESRLSRNDKASLFKLLVILVIFSLIFYYVSNLLSIRHSLRFLINIILLITLYPIMVKALRILNNIDKEIIYNIIDSIKNSSIRKLLKAYANLMF
ncbi:MAG: putative polysaccharide biosynthesis protein? [Candidatus Micrarchaeota archaeon]|nr:MAG: putative polysaccharide biosynthesis protein? [Candidatus Micrarchaeota archaeon]